MFAPAKATNGGWTPIAPFDFDEREPGNLKRRAVDNLRRIKVICIGAGKSGILTDILVLLAMSHVMPTNSPSKTNSSWSRYRATGAEIQAYLKRTATKYGADKYMKFGHFCEKAEWNKLEGRWHVTLTKSATNETFVDTCDVLLSAVGPLNKWEWPQLPFLTKVKSSLMLQGAVWNDTIQLDNKVVGVIGNGSSAVQIKLISFQRSSTWITAGFAQECAGEHGDNFNYSEEQKREFAEDPAAYLKYRKLVQAGMIFTRVNFDRGLTVKQTSQFSRLEMIRKLKGKEHLISKIVPRNYAVGCRRPTPGSGYLECLVEEEKCEVTFSQITEVTEEGVVTADGRRRRLDVLVCATGFDVSFRPRFPVVGDDNLDLRDAWKDQPYTYLSATVPKFPSYFMINGPFGPYAHGSILPTIEITTRYVAKFIVKLQTEDVESFSPKQDAVDDFKRHREHFLKRTAWSSPCRSWFKGGTIDGPILMWPGSRIHFLEGIANPRWEDYDWKYRYSNRLSFFGDGFCQRELDGGDRSWYIEAA
ncbi:uncharacterized protein A1O9_11827 [Exophiala aquamarina CBS 119918]|uniref:L-ornithine N(5)-oxygenase n=1 Tax=Exophiala aquamarina CBS 119918 TaxID=1182545 RepID=A0A072P9F5_9EURO|nr:uncharacterized protein A1O9_11827 [Exophiala aquamarina CBS 119918]KEF52200.1 hypothetical protein A1O9_11827 [Exophiala aquamarina CBS 119918]